MWTSAATHTTRKQVHKMFTDSRTVLGSITAQDSYVAGLWNLSDLAWMALTETERQDYRNRVVYAPNFSAEGK